MMKKRSVPTMLPLIPPRAYAMPPVTLMQGGHMIGRRQLSQPVIPHSAMTIRSQSEQTIPELKARIEPRPVNQKQFYLNDI